MIVAVHLTLVLPTNEYTTGFVERTWQIHSPKIDRQRAPAPLNFNYPFHTPKPPLPQHGKTERPLRVCSKRSLDELLWKTPSVRKQGMVGCVEIRSQGLRNAKETPVQNSSCSMQTTMTLLPRARQRQDLRIQSTTVPLVFSSPGPVIRLIYPLHGRGGGVARCRTCARVAARGEHRTLPITVLNAVLVRGWWGSLSMHTAQALLLLSFTTLFAHQTVRQPRELPNLSASLGLNEINTQCVSDLKIQDSFRLHKLQM